MLRLFYCSFIWSRICPKMSRVYELFGKELVLNNWPHSRYAIVAEEAGNAERVNAKAKHVTKCQCTVENLEKEVLLMVTRQPEEAN